MGVGEGDRVRLCAPGHRSPPEATAGDREKALGPARPGGRGLPGCGGGWRGPGAMLPATRLLGTLRAPARAGAAISVLIKELQPRPPGPRPRPSYRPIAIKSPTCRAAAKRTRQPPAPRNPGDARGMGLGLALWQGSGAHFFSASLTLSKQDWGGVPQSLVPPGPQGGRGLPPSHPSPPHLTAPLSSPLPTPPPPGFPSPGCVICIFTFKFPLPSLSPVAALRVGSRCSLYLPRFLHPRYSSLLSSPPLCSSLETRSPSLSPSCFPRFPAFPGLPGLWASAGASPAQLLVACPSSPFLGLSFFFHVVPPPPISLLSPLYLSIPSLSFPSFSHSFVLTNLWQMGDS